MKKNIQQINLIKHVPVDIRIWSGCFELYTHPELRVKVDAGNISNMDIVPELMFTGDHITISNQKNWLGNVHSHLDELFVREEATLEVISGDVYIDSEDQSCYTIKIRV